MINQQATTPRLNLKERLNLTLGERLAMKFRTDRRLKMRGYVVGTMKTDDYTQVDLRCGMKPLA
jgi:hypothetical protein